MATRTLSRRVVQLPRAAVADYRSWKALGPGGLPDNATGWTVTTILRTLSRDPYTLRSVYNTDIDGIPDRARPRPVIAKHPIPHRQTDHYGNPELIAREQAYLEELAAERSDLQVGRSQYERHVQALQHRNRTRRPGNTRLEIAHVHPSDGSIHIVMTDGLADAVIARGWGERHPLSGRRILRLPRNYLLLYAAENETDLTVHHRLIDLASAQARTVW